VTPKHSIEAEMSALGAMILSKKAARLVRSIVKCEDFYRPTHRTIFNSFCRLMDQGRELDLVTVPADLEAHAQFSSIGGLEYLIQVAESVPSATNADHYASIVADLALIRRIAEFGEKTVSVSNDPDLEPSEKLASVQSWASGLGRGGRVIYDVSEIDWETAPEGVPSGMAWIDENTESKGWPKGQMSVVAARKKVGKTSALCQFARHALKLGKRVLYVTLADLTKGQVMRRMVRQETGWAEPPADMFLAEKWHRQVKALRTLEWELKMADTVSIGSSFIEDIVPYIQSFTLDFKFDLVCIDYFQRIESRRERDIVRALGRVSKDLSSMAAECDFALLVGSQLSEKRVTAWSQVLEDDCGVLLDLDRPEDESTHIDAAIKYNRWGKAGSFDLTFDTKRLVFF